MKNHVNLLKRPGVWPVFALILWGMASTGLLADTVTLKDGTVIDGKIVNQDSETVTIEVAHSGGAIVQTRQVKMADVAAIKVLTDEERAAQAEETEWAELSKRKVNPMQSASLDVYDWVIARFQAFAKRYPNSPHQPEIAGLMAPWQEERKQVAAGLVKQNGEWMSAAELDQQKSDAEARQAIDVARGMFANGKYVQALQQLGKVSAMPVEEGLKTEAQDLITQIYSVWYPHLDRRNIELQGEVNKARTTLEDARRELASAQQSVKIDAGFNKDGSSTTKFGQSTAKAAAAQRLAQAKAKFDSAQTALSKLENEQKFVTTYHTFARANADRLKVRDVIAKVEQAKNPTVAPSPTSGSQAAIDKHRRRLASESSGGVLADMTRWGEDNWPWAAALLAGLLYLLYKYLIK